VHGFVLKAEVCDASKAETYSVAGYIKKPADKAGSFLCKRYPDKLSCNLFTYDVQCRTRFEPFDLLLVVSVLHFYYVPASIRMIECDR
jgi:hypothetical protein